VNAYFIAHDAHDEPTVWRRTEGEPVAVITAREVGEPELWALFVDKYGKSAPTYGMCLWCGAVEVALVKAIGTTDLSGIGEHHAYPTGYGCEVCA
jgi:hypothetical protein